MITHGTDYTFAIRLRTDFEAVEGLVREALQKEGFGVLTEIDVREAFREKLGRSFRPYKILGACNPPLAYEALSNELELGALLPCNVVLYEENGDVVVMAMDPEAVLSLVSKPAVEEIAREVRVRLERVLKQVGESGRDAADRTRETPDNP